MMALGSWWMQESKFPPPLSQLRPKDERIRFFLFSCIGRKWETEPSGRRESILVMV